MNSCEYYTKDKSIPITKSKILSSENFLSIVFNNIDGNAANFDAFTADLCQYKHQFSIIVIAETNISDAHQNLYQIEGYKSEYLSKFSNKRKGSGLGIYICNQYQFHKIDQLCHCSENLESIFIEITNTEQPITIGVLYHPPNGKLSEFISELEALLRILPQNNVWITGDFNINLLQPKTRTQFEQLIYSYNFVLTISTAAHERNLSPTLIDNILTNSEGSLVKSGILESRTFNHYPIFNFVDSQTKPQSNCKKQLPTYDFCESNIDKFIMHLSDEVSKTRYDYNSEEDFSKFATLVYSKAEEHFRIYANNNGFSKSCRNRLLNPWITSGLINSIHRKCVYYEKWKKSCNKSQKSGNDELYLRYKNYRQKLRKIIKSAKKAYYSKQFENANGNLKKTWNLINSLRGKQSKSNTTSFIVGSKTVENAQDVSNEFNKFFNSIAKKMNAKAFSSELSTPIDSKGFREYLNNGDKITSSMFMEDCSETEIEEIIMNLENDKASDIAIRVLKKCSKYISEHLMKFFNSFMTNGSFPTILIILLSSVQ